MGIPIPLKVMISSFACSSLTALSTLSILLVGFLVTPSTASFCIRDQQYFDQVRQVCVECTACLGDLVVLRPCHVDTDTICGTLRDLLAKSGALQNTRHHHHRHERHHRINDGDLQQSFEVQHHEQQERQHSSEELTSGGHLHRDVNAPPPKIEWTFGADVGLLQQQHHNNAMNDLVPSSSTSDVVNSDKIPLTGVETLVWDWQAVALTMAVFSCILFFVVIALYSFYQAKQWRRLKENFEADVEEISARLSLMAASSTEKGDTLEPSFAPIHDGPYKHNRCVYLDQLFHLRKHNKMGSEATGNVYIEETNTNTLINHD